MIGIENRLGVCNAGDRSSILKPGISPAEGNGNPLQYSCLENPMDRGAWWVTVHSISKSQTQMKQLSRHAGISNEPTQQHLSYAFL